MTVGIAQEYFDNNLAGTTGFALDQENGIYTKTIEETDLNFEFSADTDGKCERDFDFILSNFFRYYTESLGSNNLNGIFNKRNICCKVNPSQNLRVVPIKKLSFAEDSILFQCRYARSVSVDSSFVCCDEDPSLVVGTGDLNYSFDIDVGSLGGNTNVRITPNHGFDQVAPR